MTETAAASTAAALLETLRTATGDPSLELASPPTVLKGGFYAQLLRFRLAEPTPELPGDLVARIVPKAARGAWEGCIQREVASQGFPTPTIRLIAPETSPLGQFLIVMDHVDGAPPMAGLSGARMVAQVPSLVRKLPHQLADLAAHLHRLDPEALAAELRALPDGLPTTTAGFVEAEMARSAASGRPDLVEAGERLLATEPTSTARVISHGDLHPFNVLVTADGPVLIDWTVARVAHPGFTIAFSDLMLSSPPIDVPAAAAGGLRRIGRGMSRRFLRHYASRATAATQVSAEELSWHRKVHALRILAELAEWDAAGTRPSHGHPWLVLEPVTQRELGLAVAGG